MYKKGRYKTILLSTIILITLAAIGLGSYIYQGGFSESTGTFERSVSSDDGLVGYWSFDEGSAVDYSGNGNDGTVNDATATSDGHRNGAMSFDGANDYIETPYTSLTDFGTEDFTIAAWIYIPIGANCAPGCGIIDKATAGYPTHDAVDLSIEDGNTIRFLTRDTISNQNDLYTGSITQGEWHHIVATRTNGNTNTVYLDGIEFANQTAGSNIDVSFPNIPLYIGTYSSTRYFNGTIDEVRIYNRSLSADEVYEQYKDKVGIYLDKTTKTKPYSCDENTVALWHFDGSASDTCGTNDGTLVGDAAYGQGKFNSKGLELDGDGDYGNFGTISEINFSESHTISLWTKLSQFGDPNSNCGDKRAMLISKEVSYYGVKIKSILGNKLYFSNYHPSAGSKTVRSGVLKINKWIHVTVVYDRSIEQLKLYIEGELVDETSTEGYSMYNPSTGNLYIGGITANCASDYLNGTIDEVRISNVARTPEEIYEHYQQGLYRHQSIDGAEAQVWQNISWSENLPASHYPMDDSMVGYWKFEGNAKDASGNGNDGTVYGATLTEGGKVGKGYEFDGIDDYIYSGTDSSLDLGTGDFTMSGWIKINNGLTNNAIISRATSNWYRWSFMYDYHQEGGRFQLHGWNGNTFIIKTSETYVDSCNEWHQVSVTRSGTTVKIYVDGTLSNSASIASDYEFKTTQSTRVGFVWDYPKQDIYYTNGSIDEVAIYNRALSSDEITNIYESTKLYFQTRTSSDNSTWSKWSGNNPVPSAYEENKTLLKLDFDRSMQGYSNEQQLTSTDINKTGLVGYWKLDGNADDYSGYGNDGTVYGAASTADGKVDGGYLFDSVDDYVDCGNDVSLDITNAITIGAWVKRQNNWNTIVGKDAPHSTKKGYTLSIYGTNVPFMRIGDGTNYHDVSDSTSPLDVDKWYHIVGTYDPSLQSANMKIYIDGISADSLSVNESIASTTSPVRIGNRPAADYFNGTIDEAFIYNRALSLSEIQQIYSQSSYKYGKFLSGAKINESGAAIYPTGASVEDDTVLLCRFDGDHICEQGQKGTHTINYADINGAVSAWTFEGNADDVVGTNHGTVNGAVLTDDGWSGQTYEFDGAEGYVEIGDIEQLDGSNIDFSISAWFKTTHDLEAQTAVISKGANIHAITSQQGWILLKRRSGNGNRCRFIMIDENANILSLDGNQAGAINDGQWHNVIVTIDSQSNATMYIDGIIQGDSPSAASLNNILNDKSVRIGAHDQSTTPINNWMGTIDQVAIYNRALSADEIASLYGFQKAKYDKGAYFDGNSYVNMGDNDEFDITDELTIDVWIKPKKIQSQVIVSKSGDASLEHAYRLKFEENGAISFGVSGDGSSYSNGGEATSSEILNVDTWYHLVGVYKPSTSVRLYINGVEANSDTSSITSSIYNSPIPLAIGGDGKNNNLFNGTIDEVRIMRRALTPQEIQQSYLGNINASSGTISFHVKPSWAGSDSAKHTFFDEGNFKIYKDTSNNLVFKMLDTQISTPISSWSADAWHHIGATWDSNMILTIDGTQKNTTTAPSVENLTSFMFLGNAKDFSSACDCVIDDFNIFNYAKPVDELQPMGYTTPGESISAADTRYLQWQSILATTDPNPSPSFSSVTISSQNANTAPSVTSLTQSPTELNRGGTITVYCDGTDDYTSEGDLTPTIQYRLPESETWVDLDETYADNSWQATITTTYNDDQLGTWDFSCMLSDPSLNSGTETDSDTVTVNNNIPTIASITATPDPVKGGSTVTISTGSIGDTELEDLNLYCAIDDSSPSAANYNCTNSSSSPYSLSCQLTAPADNTLHTVYCKVYDSHSYSSAVSDTFTSDSTAPTITFGSLAGDTSPPYWDILDDSSTYVDIDLSENNCNCKWSYSDISYSSMANNCNSPSGTDISCNLGDVTETSSKTVYIGCEDGVGNIQSSTLSVTFGVDFTNPSTYITNLTGGTTGGIHLPGYQIIMVEDDIPVENVPTKVYTWECRNDLGEDCTIPGTPATGNIDNGTLLTFNTRGTNRIKFYSTDESGHTQTPEMNIEIKINSLPVADDISYGLNSYTGQVGDYVLFYCDGTDANSGGALDSDYNARIWIRENGAGDWGTAKTMTFDGATHDFRYIYSIPTGYPTSYDIKCQIQDDYNEWGNEYSESSVFTVVNSAPIVDDVSLQQGVAKFDTMRIYCDGSDPDGFLAESELNATLYLRTDAAGTWDRLDGVIMDWEGTNHYYDWLVTDDGGTEYDVKCDLSDGDAIGIKQEFKFIDNESFVSIADDWDGDGVPDTTDTLEGTGTNLDTTLTIDVLVDGVINNNPSGSKLVEFKEGSDVIVKFNNNFSSNELIMPNIKIDHSSTGAGSVLVKGLSGISKTLHVPKVLGTGRICVKDAEITSIDQITPGCTDEADETLFTSCSGQTISGITCTDQGNYYELTGLMHSAATESGTARLSIWSEGTYWQLDDIFFYANYTNTTNHTITGADCDIWFEDTGWDNMTFSDSLHRYNRTFTGAGFREYNVSCTHATYTNLTINDSFTITSSAIPEFSTMTLGLGLITVLAGLFVIRRKKK